MSKPMNQGDFVDAARDQFNISHAQAKRIVDWFFDSIEDRLAAGGEVAIKNFGRFSTVSRKARTGRNPHTGEPIEVPAKTAVSFKAGGRLAERVNAI